MLSILEEKIKDNFKEKQYSLNKVPVIFLNIYLHVRIWVRTQNTDLDRQSCEGSK